MRVSLPGPTVGAALRAAAMDLYYQSIRFVPANVAWGAGLLTVLALTAWLSPLLGLVVAPLLCLPLVGIVRLAGQVVRDQDVVLSDAVAAIRAYALPAVAAGIAFLGSAIVFTMNVIAGVATGGPVGWALATLAAWGLVASWVLGLAFWPLLVDPARDALSLGRRARLAGLVVVAEPLRFGGFGLAAAVITLISTLAFVALLSVSVAYLSLLAARIALPAADELEARLAAAAGTGRA